MSKETVNSLCVEAIARLGRPAKTIDVLTDAEKEQLASSAIAYPDGIMFPEVVKPLFTAVDARGPVEADKPAAKPVPKHKK